MKTCRSSLASVGGRGGRLLGCKAISSTSTLLALLGELLITNLPGKLDRDARGVDEGAIEVVERLLCFFVRAVSDETKLLEVPSGRRMSLTSVTAPFCEKCSRNLASVRYEGRPRTLRRDIGV